MRIGLYAIQYSTVILVRHADVPYRPTYIANILDANNAMNVGYIHSFIHSFTHSF